jgi:preprotein translocase subunit YajC
VSTIKLSSLLLLLSLLAILVFNSGCVPAEGTEQDPMSNITLIIFLVVIIAFIYLTMIRPQRKQQQKRKEMMSQLKRGDKVVTSAGIFGEIENIADNSVILKVESGATIKVVKSTVMVLQQKEESKK